MEVDPVWAPVPAGRRGRPALSRAGIVAAAVDIADGEGLDAVSMPRLARALGVAPMSLYRHVPHKDALLALMVDAAIGSPPELAGAARRDGLARWARANREVFLAHPWTLPLVTGTQRMGPAECAWAEAFLAHESAHGTDAAAAVVVLTALNAYVRGASTPIGDRVPSAAALEASGRAGEYPHLLGLLPRDDAARGLDDPAPVFEAGLAVVLAGCGPEPGAPTVDPTEGTASPPTRRRV